VSPKTGPKSEQQQQRSKPQRIPTGHDDDDDRFKNRDMVDTIERKSKALLMWLKLTIEVKMERLSISDCSIVVDCAIS
jgi:hypothetical protein